MFHECVGFKRTQTAWGSRELDAFGYLLLYHSCEPPSFFPARANIFTSIIS